MTIEAVRVLLEAMRVIVEAIRKIIEAVIKIIEAVRLFVAVRVLVEVLLALGGGDLRC